MAFNIKLVLFGVLLAVSTLVVADLCSLGSKQIEGNCFCQPVTSIQYSNVGFHGVYNRVIGMKADGTCDMVPQAFSGPISPLDKEVSFHARGPAQIHQFAVYTPASSIQSKLAGRLLAHSAKHGKKKLHNHGAPHDLKARQEVSATVHGKVVSWGNNYFGPSTVPADQLMLTATTNGATVSWMDNWLGSTSLAQPARTSLQSSSVRKPTSSRNICVPPAAPSTLVTIPSLKPSSANPASNSHASFTAPAAKSSSSFDPPAGPGFDSSTHFHRISYYEAKSQKVENLAFLGNHGGQGSGVFDYHFGASLAYTNSKGTGGAASPQVLANQLIPSGSEVIIMHGDDCGDGSCGYYRPGSVAHHGFNGADKIFMVEFSMPMDGKKGFEGGMPALWILNAEIPRTAEYMNCSCWQSGCGEFDIAEALFDGSKFLKSTLHTNTPGGDSDYLARPTSGSMKLAVVFSSATNTIHIQVLDSSTEFSPTLSAHDVNKMCGEAMGPVSHFAVSH